MEKTRLGFCITGSFCTFERIIPEIEKLVKNGYDVTPILSETAYNTDTRFGKASDFTAIVKEICKNENNKNNYRSRAHRPEKAV